MTTRTHRSPTDEPNQEPALHSQPDPADDLGSGGDAEHNRRRRVAMRAAVAAAKLVAAQVLAYLLRRWFDQ
jgi:hypothetical protein